jgi:hypothetical protein
VADATTTKGIVVVAAGVVLNVTIGPEVEEVVVVVPIGVEVELLDPLMDVEDEDADVACPAAKITSNDCKRRMDRIFFMTKISMKDFTKQQ